MKKYEKIISTISIFSVLTITNVYSMYILFQDNNLKKINFSIRPK